MTALPLARPGGLGLLALLLLLAFTPPAQADAQAAQTHSAGSAEGIVSPLTDLIDDTADAATAHAGNRAIDASAPALVEGNEHTAAVPTAEEPGVSVAEVSIDERIRQLPHGSFNDRRAVAEELAMAGDPRVAGILTALADGRLLALDEPRARILIRDASGRLGRDAITGEPVSAELIAAGRRIPVHNPLRNTLRSLVAVATISDPAPERRATSLRRLLRDGVSPEMLDYLDARVEQETVPLVLDLLQTVRAMAHLESDYADQRLQAIEVLRGSLLAEVRVRLDAAAERDEDAAVRDSAAEAIDSIETRIAVYRFTENLFFGLSAGSVLLLAAIGLAITFGVMGVINMAHGELIMIGAYTTWFLQTLMPEALSASILLAIPAAFVVAGLVGIAMERGVIQFLYGRPLETLLATFGISLILQQAVRTLFSPLNRPVASPDWLSGSLYINPVLSLTWSRLYIVIFAILVFVALLLVMKKTSLGLKVRAVAQNRPMARALGVRTSWVDALTFGLGAGIAGVAGVALSQLTNVGPNMGQAYVIDSFMVVVFGGVGNLWGTLVGAMGLGMMTKFLEPHTGAVLAKILVLIFIILFIQRRPRGLFPKKGRAAEA